MLKFLKSKAVKLLAIGVLLATTLGVFSGTTISVTSPLSRNTIDLRVGYVRIAMASGNMDFPLTQVGIQAALNSLPITGGRINLISTSGTVTFAGTVSRAIPNVTWVGTGNVPLLQNNGVTPLISTSGQTGWVFRDFSTDAGGITRSADTVMDNVHLGATYYALASTGTSNFSSVTDSGLTSGRITMAGASGLLSDDADLTFSGNTTTITVANITALNAPTGRGATFVVAASDSSVTQKAQADYVVTTNASSTIQTALNAVPITGGNVYVLDGNYSIDTTLTISSNTTLTLSSGAIFNRATVSFITLLKNKNYNATSIVDENIVVQGGSWNGSKSTYTIVGFNWDDANLINLKMVRNSKIKNVVGYDAKDYGFVLNTGTTDSTIEGATLRDSKGMALAAGLRNSFTDSTSYHNSRGIFIGDNETLSNIANNKIYDNTFDIFFENPVNGSMFTGNVIAISAANQTIGWDTQVYNVSFVGNTFWADNMTTLEFLIPAITATNPGLIIDSNVFAWSGVGTAPDGVSTKTGVSVRNNTFKNLPISVFWDGDAVIEGNHFISTTGAQVIRTAATTATGRISSNVFDGVATYDVMFAQDTKNVEISQNEFLTNSGGIAIYDTGTVGSNNVTVIGNKFSGITYGIFEELNTPSNQWYVFNNSFGGGVTPITHPTFATFNLHHNIGLVSENSGSSVGTGAQQTIAHGLGFTPSRNQIGLWSDNTSSVTISQSAAPDATNIYVTNNTSGSAWHWATVGN